MGNKTPHLLSEASNQLKSQSKGDESGGVRVVTPRSKESLNIIGTNETKTKKAECQKGKNRHTSSKNNPQPLKRGNRIVSYSKQQREEDYQCGLKLNHSFGGCQDTYLSSSATTIVATNPALRGPWQSMKDKNARQIIKPGVPSHSAIMNARREFASLPRGDVREIDEDEERFPTLSNSDIDDCSGYRTTKTSMGGRMTTCNQGFVVSGTVSAYGSKGASLSDEVMNDAQVKSRAQTCIAGENTDKLQRHPSRASNIVMSEEPSTCHYPHVGMSGSANLLDDNYENRKASLFSQQQHLDKALSHSVPNVNANGEESISQQQEIRRTVRLCTSKKQSKEANLYTLHANESRKTKLRSNSADRIEIFVKPLPKGYAVKSYKNGDRYEGELVRGKRDGYGLMFMSNGEVYAGQWSQDSRSGRGLQFYSPWGRYEGDFQIDLRCGWGMLVMRRHGTFLGQFKNNKKHGRGLLIHSRGEVYAEWWSQGKLTKRVCLKELLIQKKRLPESEKYTNRSLDDISTILSLPSVTTVSPTTTSGMSQPSQLSPRSSMSLRSSTTSMQNLLKSESSSNSQLTNTQTKIVDSVALRTTRSLCYLAFPNFAPEGQNDSPVFVDDHTESPAVSIHQNFSLPSFINHSRSQQLHSIVESPLLSQSSPVALSEKSLNNSVPETSHHSPVVSSQTDVLSPLCQKIRTSRLHHESESMLKEDSTSNFYGSTLSTVDEKDLLQGPPTSTDQSCGFFYSSVVSTAASSMLRASICPGCELTANFRAEGGQLANADLCPSSKEENSDYQEGNCLCLPCTSRATISTNTVSAFVCTSEEATQLNFPDGDTGPLSSVMKAQVTSSDEAERTVYLKEFSESQFDLLRTRSFDCEKEALNIIPLSPKLNRKESSSPLQLRRHSFPSLRRISRRQSKLVADCDAPNLAFSEGKQSVLNVFCARGSNDGSAPFKTELKNFEIKAQRSSIPHQSNQRAAETMDINCAKNNIYQSLCEGNITTEKADNDKALQSSKPFGPSSSKSLQTDTCSASKTIGKQTAGHEGLEFNANADATIQGELDGVLSCQTCQQSSGSEKVMAHLVTQRADIATFKQAASVFVAEKKNKLLAKCREEMIMPHASSIQQTKQDSRLVSTRQDDHEPGRSSIVRGISSVSSCGSALDEGLPELISWSVEDIGKFLESLGLQFLVPLFQKHQIGGEELLNLTEKDLECELRIRDPTHRQLLVQAAQSLTRCEARRRFQGQPWFVILRYLRDLFRECLISSSALRRCRVVGEGGFGLVYKGLWGGDAEVAIKAFRVSAFTALSAQRKPVTSPPRQPKILPFIDAGHKEQSQAFVGHISRIPMQPLQVVTSTEASPQKTDVVVAKSALAQKKRLHDERIAERQRHRLALMLLDLADEAKVLMSLRHPNVTRFWGVCLNIEKQWLITQFVPGGSLFTFIHSSKGVLLNSARIARIALGICSGMAYVHTKGMLHCDLKSPNILLDENLEPKICDFGLALRTLDCTAAATRGRIGTPQWMAPEILRGTEYSKAADVFSFGVILWEMLSRRVPYSSLTLNQVIAAVGWGHHRLEPVYNCPDGLSKIMKACLNRVISKRPSFEQLVEEFSVLLESDELESDSERLLSKPFKKLKETTRRTLTSVEGMIFGPSL